MPVSGEPGVIIRHDFFQAGIEIGNRFSEWPDSIVPHQFDSKMTVPAPAGVIRYPADDDQLEFGDFRHFEHFPVPECWRWWNTHQKNQCQYVNDVGGMGPVGVTLSGFSFAEGYGPAGRITAAQKLLMTQLNSDHVLEPVWVGQNFGWAHCYLLKIMQPVFDPEADWLIPPGTEGRYDIAIECLVRNDGVSAFEVLVAFHIRFSDVDKEPVWNIIPLPILSLHWNQVGGREGNYYKTPRVPLGGWGFDPEIGISIADIESHNYPPVSLAGSTLDFQNLILNAGTAELFNVPTRETTGIPQQGPLDMKLRPKLEVLALHDGSTGSVAAGVKMPIGALHFDVGDWHPVGAPADALVVPDGVTKIRGIAQIDISPGTTAWTHLVRRNDAHPVATPAQTTLNEGSVAARSNMVLPPTTVVAGDEIGNYASSVGRNWDDDPFRTWLYLESVESEIFAFSQTVVAKSIPIPPAGTQIYLFRTPPSVNNYELSRVSISLLDSKSPANDIDINVIALREATRLEDSMLSTALKIDADTWTSDVSATPHVVNPLTATILTGDMMALEVLVAGVGGTGLICELEFTEPN